MAWEALLGRVPLPAESIHRMMGESPDLAGAARAYADAIRSRLAADGDGRPRLDLVLLGIGEDGHTASLFPGAPEGEGDPLVRAVGGPPGGVRRLTLTLSAINAARVAVFLILGASKAHRVTSILNRGGGGESLPAAQVRPTEGRLLWILDAPAARGVNAAEKGNLDN